MGICDGRVVIVTGSGRGIGREDFGNNQRAVRLCQCEYGCGRRGRDGRRADQPQDRVE